MMSKSIVRAFSALVLAASVSVSCGKESGNGEVVKNDPPKLLTLSVKAADNSAVIYEDVNATISGDQVALQFPSASDITALVVSFTTNEGDVVRLGDATGAVLKSGESAVDFSSPVTFFLTNADGKLNAVYVITTSRKSMVFGSPVKVHADSVASVSMKVNPVSGVPYIAYSVRGDKANPARTKLANVLKLGDSAWESVGAADFGAGVSDYINVDFNKDGVPYVAYQSNSKNPKDASVLKLAGAQWEYVDDEGLHASMEDATSTYTCFGVVGTNEVVVGQVSGARNSTFARYGFVVSNYNGSSWTSSYDGANGSEASYLCRAASNSDAACVMYLTRNNPRKWGVSKYSAGTWTSLRSAYMPEGATTVYATISTFDIVMGSDGTVYVLTADDAENPGAVWKIRVEKYDPAAGTWSVVGGGSISYEMGSSSSAKDARLCVAPDGTVMVFYVENGASEIKSVSVDPETLQWGAPSTVLAEGFNDKLNVGFAPNGVCYVVYRDKESRLYAIEGK